MKPKVWKIFHIFFRTGIAFKWLNGLLETAGGLVLLIVTNQQIINFVYRLFRHELLEDPTDFFANILIRLSSHLTPGTQLFAAVFLLGHGIVKLILATSIWLNKLWAFPVAGLVLSGLVVYQIVRITSTHSIVLILLTIIDVAIIAMLWPEYKHLTSKRKNL
jgi:uncharacterized membrane protein